MRWILVGLIGLWLACPAWAERVYHFEQLRECEDAAQDSADIIAQLEASLGVKLHADLPTDTVNGAVTILHAQPPALHEITVTIYDQDELPMKQRKSTLKAPPVLPDEASVKREIRKIPLRKVPPIP